MSGICGIIHTTKYLSDEKSLQSIHRWNYPYGSSRSDTITRDNLSFGCCLEHITNAPIPSQSIFYKDNLIAVIDAVLYNRDELIPRLSNAALLSDEELLLTYINTYGIHALKEVNGDFAGVVYNTKLQTVTLFRDHMGVRPLYYYADEATVAFSTDLRGLLSYEHIKPALNEDWLYKRISGHAFTGTENTELANIFCVPPSGYISFSCNLQIQLTEKKRYWTLCQKKIRYPSFEQYADRMRELITDSVQRRLNVFPGLIGAELSGGLDSGIIDILINRAGRKAVYHSWSTDPELLPYAEDDERLVIADICKQENIACHYCDLSADFSADDNIAKKTVYMKNQPLSSEYIYYDFALPPRINTLSICKTAQFIDSQGAHVVFSGHGGDEGVSHRSNSYELFYHHEYFHFLKQMYRLSYRNKHRVLSTLKKTYTSVFVTSKELKEPFVMHNATPELFLTSFHDKMSKHPIPIQRFGFDPKGYVLDGGSRNRLDVVALLGALGSARYVVPFLDYRVIDYALSIPRYLYRKGNTDRYIFREAFKSMIPDSLYRLTIKANNSKKNLKPDEDWYEKFEKGKHFIYENLDCDFWGQYLNYDEITAWLNRGKPSTEEEKMKDEFIMQNLSDCLNYQNMIVQIRGKL